MKDPVLHDLQFNENSPTNDNSVSEKSFIEEFDNRFTNKSEIENGYSFGKWEITFFCEDSEMSIVFYLEQSGYSKVFAYYDVKEVFEMKFTDTQIKAFDQSNLDALFNIFELKLN